VKFAQIGENILEMEDMMTELLGYLRHEKLEVRKQAISAIFQYSDNPEVLEFVKKSDMMKAIKACLYDLVSFSSWGLVPRGQSPKDISDLSRT
jgi:ferredoxin-fold anticodon binding domain-containing protein